VALSDLRVALCKALIGKGYREKWHDWFYLAPKIASNS
jgi:hypothetical protein